MSEQRRPHRGLRVRMVALSTLLLLLVLLAVGAVFQSVLRGSLRTAGLQVARSHLNDLAADVREGTVPPAPAPGGAERLVQVVAADGRLLPPDSRAGPVRGLPRLAPGETAEVRRRRIPGEEPDDYLVLLRGARGPQGEVTVALVVAVDDLTDPADRTRTLGLVLLPVLLGSSAGVTWVTVGRTLAPIEALRRTAEDVSAADLERRLEVTGPDDEVGRLGRTLNGMLHRLDVAQQAQRRFVADAAHELRTPVATLRAVLESRTRPPAAQEWAVLRADLLAETERADRLVEALLLLARSDLRALRASPRPVDVDDLLHAAAGRARVRTGVPVRTAQVAAVQVRTDPELLERVVDNLLDNACRHAATAVSLAAVALPDGVEVRVDDDGPGIAPEHRADVFGRFVRLDEGRARAVGGAGLGLAIVTDLVRVLGGTVAVHDAPGRGARFTVTLPNPGPSA